MSYEIGQLVKVVGRQCGHEFGIGQVVRVRYDDVGSYRCESTDGKEVWWLINEEISGDDCSVTIIKEEYDRLVSDSTKLSYLEGHGVDNWQGYDDAMTDYQEATDNE